MALFVANWKMYKTYDEAIAFAQTYCDELAALSTHKSKLVIAPSFVCLEALSKILAYSNVAISAQNCAAHKTGAYTGEVDAASLAQIGCTYAIVGHSERRQHFDETDETVAQKTELILASNMTPIICIGETQEDFDEGHTLEVLEFQLSHIMQILKNSKKMFYIAYEPIWSIGTGKIPTKEDLENTFEWLSDRIDDPHCTLLYGGSVDETNAKKLLQVPRMGGFLIGKASCDFQSLKKIVSLAQIDY